MDGPGTERTGRRAVPSWPTFDSRNPRILCNKLEQISSAGSQSFNATRVCMYLALSGCRRPDQITHPFSAWCRGLCARSLADRTHQHNITNQNHTVLPCTLLRLKHTPASQHQEDSAQYCTYLILVGGSYGQYPTPFRPANHPLSHALTHWSPPQATLQKARPTWHLSTLYATYCRWWSIPALPCPVSPRLASPLSRCSPHLITQYAIWYKVSIINPQPVLCPRPNNIAPLLRPVLAPTHPNPLLVHTLSNRPLDRRISRTFPTLQRISSCTLANTMAAKPRL